MKKLSILFWLVVASILWNNAVLAQQATPTPTDATVIRTGGIFTPRSVSLISGSVIGGNPVYRAQGDYSSSNSSFSAASNVQVDMFFMDGANRLYRITSVESATLGTTNNLTIQVRPISNVGAQMAEPSTIQGFIYRPTPNLLLPQWVANMGPAVQAVLLSHMANMLDARFGAISAPSMSIKTANYVASAGDDTILFDVTSAPGGLTLTLPAASSASGKLFRVGKVDESTNLLNFSPSLRMSPTVSLNSLNYPRTFSIQSDGTSWWIVNQL